MVLYIAEYSRMGWYSIAAGVNTVRGGNSIIELLSILSGVVTLKQSVLILLGMVTL